MSAISVVMSTCNTPEDYLREAIESILNQTFSDFELIIIDDGSTGNDCDIVRSYDDSRIVLLPNGENRGLPFSLNRGISAARGKYIARMDSDDVALPRRLEEQFKYMEAHPDTAMTGTLAWRFGDQQGLAGSIVPDADMACLQLFKCRIVHPSVMLRRSFLEEHGLRYNEEFRRSQDYELWSRVQEHGKIEIIPQILMKYRFHARQASTAFVHEQRMFGCRIYQRLMRSVGIDLTEQEYDLHYCLVNAKPAEDVQALIRWAEKLREANARCGRFAPRAFNAELDYRLFLNLARNLVEKKYSWRGDVLCQLLKPGRAWRFIRQECRYRAYAAAARRTAEG